MSKKLQNGPSPKDDPFVATFANESIVLTLRRGAGGYVGTVTLDGASAPVRARRVGATALEGVYSDEGEEAPFRASLTGDTLTVAIAEGTLVLTRRRSAPAKPAATPERPVAPKPAPSAKSGNGTPQRFADTGWGIRFVAPPGWVGRDVGGAFLLGSKTLKGVLLVMPHEARTTAELRAAAAEGWREDDGSLEMRPVGPVRALGKNGLAAAFEGTAGPAAARAYAAGLISPHGVGALVLALVEAQSYGDAYPKAVEALARSVVFTRPVVPAFVGEWKKSLRGSRLTYLWSYFSGGGSGAYSSGSQRTVISLFADGRFAYSNNGHVAIDTGASAPGNALASGGNADAAQGRWDVRAEGRDAALVLRFDTGRVAAHRLRYENRKLTLDGRRYFWTSLGR